MKLTKSDRASVGLFALILLLCATFAHGQTNRWDIGNPGSAGVVTVSGSGLPFLVAEPGVTLAWCNYPANTAPCTNYATTYTSAALLTPCSNNTQVVLQGSNTCQATGDNFGNLGVYTPSGIFAYTLTVGGITTGPFTATVGVSGPGSPSGSLQANNAGFFAGVPNSSVNFSNGNMNSTAAWGFGSINATGSSAAGQFVSNTANPATSGQVRLAQLDQILWRNVANNANEGFSIDSSDRMNMSAAGGFGLTGATAKLWFGGFTSSFPMLKPVSTGLQLRLGDDSADAGPFEAFSYVVNGSQALNGVQGTDTKIVTAGAFTGGTGATACQDASGGVTTSTSVCASRVIVNVSSCQLAANGGEWNCTGTINWGVTLPSTTYYADCALSIPQPPGTYTIPAGYDAHFFWNVKTTTTMTYAINDDHSGSNGAVYNLSCVAID